MATIPQPLPLSVAQFKPPEGEPTYTQIFNATMGDLGTPTDGMDARLAEMLAIGDALAAEMAAEAAADNVGSALSLFAAIDPGGLASTIAAFEATIPTGQAHVAALDSMGVPQLFEMPIDLGFDGGIGAPPTQVTVDFGSLKLGSAPILKHLGQLLNDPHRGFVGMVQVILYSGDPDIFKITETYTYDVHHIIISASWDLHITPAKLGDFIAQVNTSGGQIPPTIITTYKLSVVP